MRKKSSSILPELFLRLLSARGLQGVMRGSVRLSARFRSRLAGVMRRSVALVRSLPLAAFWLLVAWV